MMKRRIAVIIAGIFFGTQLGIAAQDHETLTAAETDQYAAIEPTQDNERFTAAETDQYIAVESTQDQEVLAASAWQDQYVAIAMEPTQQESIAFETAEVSSPVVAYGEREVTGEPRVFTSLSAKPAEIAVPPSAEDMVGALLPAQTRYFEQRAARIQTAVRGGDVFPPSAEDMVWKPLPAQARYLEERAARIQTAVRGDVFPPSADDLAGKMLPSQVSYFDQKAPRTNVAVYGSPFLGSIE